MWRPSDCACRFADTMTVCDQKRAWLNVCKTKGAGWSFVSDVIFSGRKHFHGTYTQLPCILYLPSRGAWGQKTRRSKKPWRQSSGVASRRRRESCVGLFSQHRLYRVCLYYTCRWGVESSVHPVFMNVINSFFTFFLLIYYLVKAKGL